MKYARIVNHVAVDVRTDSPEGCFTPNIVAEFVTVPDTVQNGWSNESGTWKAPAAPAPVAPVQVEPRKPVLSPVQFKMCFTAPERIGLKALRASDAVVDDWMTLLDDPRLQEVDLNLGSTQAAIGYLVGKLNGFTDERASQVKAGTIL